MIQRTYSVVFLPSNVLNPIDDLTCMLLMVYMYAAGLSKHLGEFTASTRQLSLEKVIIS